MANNPIPRKRGKRHASKRVPARRQPVNRFADLQRELRTNKERWQAVIDNPFMGVTVLDRNHHFIMTNPIFQTMVGYDDKELKKLTPLDITPDDAQREINRILFEELQQGMRDNFEQIKQLQRKDGKLIWIQLYVFRIPSRGSSGPHTFGMVFDITEKMQAQDALRVAQAELVRAMQASRMGVMAASIAHEINQPLAGMAASADAGLRWADRKPPDLDRVRKNFKQIVHAGQRTADVIRGIRAMFKSEETPRSAIDLNKLIDDVLKLTQSEIQKRSIVVRTELAEGPLSVMANRIQVQQVLFNLVTNAIEAMEAVVDRSRSILIKTEIGSGEVGVAIEDSGSGIAPGDMEQIFSTFFTTKVTGMGMGLSICRSIIETHGGRLWASPGHPYGAVFHFTLPFGTNGDL
jgi:PAS domain S-box-containing protein